jgi:hypothetical protein
MTRSRYRFGEVASRTFSRPRSSPGCRLSREADAVQIVVDARNASSAARSYVGQAGLMEVCTEW